MIQITERAKQELKKAIEASTDDPERCMRISFHASGAPTWRMDVAREEDEVVEYENRKVLVVEADLVDSLPPGTIDIEETPDGNKLIFRR